jgi:hypothetical protein
MRLTAQPPPKETDIGVPAHIQHAIDRIIEQIFTHGIADCRGISELIGEVLDPTERKILRETIGEILEQIEVGSSSRIDVSHVRN